MINKRPKRLPLHEQNSIFKYTTIGPVIPKEMEYNLYYDEVRGDVVLQPHGTNTSCSLVQ